MPYRFEFESHNGRKKFSCNLPSNPCGHVLKNGGHCKRKVIIGMPLCYQHLQQEYHIKIAKSTIPDAGKGLFAKIPGDNNPNTVVFHQGDEVVEYIGDEISKTERIRRYGKWTAPYGVQVTREGAAVDSACRRGAGSLGNMKTGDPRENNAKLDITAEDDRLIVKATKNIKNGQEIFINYGKDYKFDEGSIVTTKPVR